MSAVTAARLATTAGALALVAVAAWWLLRSPAPPVERSLPTAATVRVGGSGPTRSPSPSPAPTSPPGTVVVQAAGAVKRPGVYHLAASARVVDLLRAAGGAAPGADTQSLALAALLADGERVYVPAVGEAPPPPPAGGGPAGAGASPSTTAALIDLNQATAAELEALPGVGPTTAAAIVDQRTRHGPFQRIDDLLDVRGIGPAKLDAFRALVRV
jgi:competence protein ComEA